jgi:hypothetical protein
MRAVLPSLRRQSHHGTALGCALLAAFAVPALAVADVIVLANRTDRELPLRFTPVKGQAQAITLKIGESLPMFLDGKANISYSSPGGNKNYLLDANCVYFFGRTPDGRVEMQKIGLGDDGTLAEGHELPGSATRAPTAVIPVKILVDEEEPARQAIWENRLRRRVEAASAILEKYFHTRLQVVAVGTWNSDNATDDFNTSLAEFERKVNPSPARLAIGFTSQWKMIPGRMHMAGTRGPLHSHILAREGNPQISEPEKLEYLVHELGHYLGAAHSPERGSVMRPVLGDNLAGRKDFRIQFDPVNTLAIAMISDEMRRRNLTKLSELSPETRKRLSQIYLELARSLPDDPAAMSYAQMVRSESGSPIVVGARQILRHIVRAAADNRALPPGSKSTEKDSSTRRQGDELTTYLVREAARAADALSADVKPEAFILAVSIGLNDAQPALPLTPKANILRAIESPSERAMRLTVLGEPTMRGRRDLAQHFLTSAQLAGTAGIQPAQVMGLTKELADSQGPSGFSFVDIAADRAGVRFAQSVLDRKISMGALGVTFTVESYMPEIEGLPEKLAAKELAAKFGGKDDPRFLDELKEIDKRIAQLPGYRPATPVFGR